MPHRSWWVPQKSRAVDKTGVAVALAFVAAIGLVAGGRGEKPREHRLPSDVPVQQGIGQASAPDAAERATGQPMPGTRDRGEDALRPSTQQAHNDGR
jgi:hypothetical protein